jgi:hypothetical protein
VSARRPLSRKEALDKAHRDALQLAQDWKQKWNIHSASEAASVLRDSQQEVTRRAAAAHILAAEEKRRSVPRLLAMMDDAETELVWSIANILGTLASRKPTRQLMRIVRHSKSPQRRDAAIYALGLLNDRRSRSLLSQIVTNDHEAPYTRGLAADALVTQIRDRHVLRVLLKCHNDPSTEVRFAVINALHVALQDNLEPEYLRGVLQQHLSDNGQLPGRPSIAELVRG